MGYDGTMSLGAAACRPSVPLKPSEQSYPGSDQGAATSPGGAHSSCLRPEGSVSGLAVSSPHKPAGINQIPSLHKPNMTTANFGEEEEPGERSLQPCRPLFANPHRVGGCRIRPLASRTAGSPATVTLARDASRRPRVINWLGEALLFPGSFLARSPCWFNTAAGNQPHYLEGSRSSSQKSNPEAAPNVPAEKQKLRRSSLLASLPGNFSVLP